MRAPWQGLPNPNTGLQSADGSLRAAGILNCMHSRVCQAHNAGSVSTLFEYACTIQCRVLLRAGMHLDLSLSHYGALRKQLLPQVQHLCKQLGVTPPSIPMGGGVEVALLPHCATPCLISPSPLMVLHLTCHVGQGPGAATTQAS